MYRRVMAFDFDGTLAGDGRVPPEIETALEREDCGICFFTPDIPSRESPARPQANRSAHNRPEPLAPIDLIGALGDANMQIITRGHPHSAPSFSFLVLGTASSLGGQR